MLVVSNVMLRLCFAMPEVFKIKTLNYKQQTTLKRLVNLHHFIPQ